MRCIYSVRCNFLLDTSGASIYVLVILLAMPVLLIFYKARPCNSDTAYVTVFV